MSIHKSIEDYFRIKYASTTTKIESQQSATSKLHNNNSLQIVNTITIHQNMIMSLAITGIVLFIFFGGAIVYLIRVIIF